MPDMPTLGAPKKQSQVVTVATAAAIFGLVVGGGYWLSLTPVS